MQTKLIFIVSIVCSIVSVSCQKKLIGTYVYKNGSSYEKINLNPDSSFIYQYSEGLAQYNSNGLWNVSNSTLFLNSDPLLTNKNGTVNESKGGNETILQLLNFSGKPLEGISVYINNTDWRTTNNVGEIVIPFRVLKFYTRFYLGYEFYYEVKNKESNKFTIYLSPSTNSMIHLSSKYKIKHNKLIDDSGKVLIKTIL
jgi:hypothetical protein